MIKNYKYARFLILIKGRIIMCFSAEASFSAAAVLGAMGYKTLKVSKSKSEFFLAAIPFLFAIQQFSEGILWLHLDKNFFSHFVSINAQRFFLTFAFLIWPVWIPLSFAAIEKVSWRRQLLFIDLALGVVLFIMNIFYAIGQPLAVQIVNHSLQYIGKAPYQMLAYPFIVIIPSFISSYKNAWFFGCLVTISYMAALYFYEMTFISVWCFFAAFTSLILYKILKDNQGYYQETKEDSQISQ